MAKFIRNPKGGRRKSSPELTEAEWTIMKVVWENEPCAAGTVQEILQESKNWAYSTVKGTMDRMAEKGFLGIDKNTPVERITQRKPAGGKLIKLPRVGGLHHRYMWKEAA